MNTGPPPGMLTAVFQMGHGGDSRLGRLRTGGKSRLGGEGRAFSCTEPIFWPPMGHAASRSVQGSDAKADDPKPGCTAAPPGMLGVISGGGYPTRTCDIGPAGAETRP